MHQNDSPAGWKSQEAFRPLFMLTPRSLPTREPSC